MADENDDRGDDLNPEQAAAPEPKTEVKVDPKTEVKADPKTEVKADPKTEAKAEPKTEAKREGDIPYSRFKAQTIKAKASAEEAQKERAAREAAEKELEALRKQLGTAPAKEEARDFDAEVEAAETALATALEDNDSKAALAAQKQIRAIERARTDSLVEQARRDAAESRKASEDRAFEETLSIVEEEFPELDPDAPQFNQRKFNLVQRLLSSFESDFPSDEALLQAVGEVFPEEEAEGEKPTEKGDVSKRGIQQKIEAARTTPPDVNSGGQDSDSAGAQSDVDPMKMTEAELAALPPAALKRLRGDEVTH